MPADRNEKREKVFRIASEFIFASVFLTPYAADPLYPDFFEAELRHEPCEPEDASCGLNTIGGEERNGSAIVIR